MPNEAEKTGSDDSDVSLKINQNIVFYPICSQVQTFWIFFILENIISLGEWKHITLFKLFIFFIKKVSLSISHNTRF